jgi:UDP-N-acetylmuramate--alanine ligase
VADSSVPDSPPPGLGPLTGRSPEHSQAGAIRAAHLVGIGGSGMRALAEVLAGRGVRLTGSDASVSEQDVARFLERGWRVTRTHAADNVPADADGLLYSPAVPAENIERTTARTRGLPEFSYHEMVARLLAERTGIGIAGTHGKSTTTAMVGWILSAAGKDPAVLCGAEWPTAAGARAGTSGLAGNGPFVVAECCEYRRHFLAMKPRIAAVLSVEPDHFDCYASFDETRAAFREFLAAIPAEGVVVLPAGAGIDADLRAAVRARACNVALLSEPTAFASIPQENDRSSPDWAAGPVEIDGAGTRWSLWRRGVGEVSIRLPLPGLHNVSNALVAAAVAGEAGATLGQIAQGLATFPGLRRRFERLGEFAGRLLIDDYAHHPTEIAATIATARVHFPGRKLVVLFQPHQISRTRALFDDFAKALALADQVVLFPIFAARERGGEEQAAVAQALSNAVNSMGTAATFRASLDRPDFTLEDSSLPGDLVIAMGAGDIGRVHYAFIRRIQGDYPG